MRPSALLAAAALLAACSSGGSTAAPSTPAPPTTSTRSTPRPTPPATASTLAPTTTEAPSGAPRTIDDVLALGRPIVLAHTGGEDEFPGSTMFAFGESVEAGVDMLDLNVRLTADGILIVQHDDAVDRQTNGTGKVAEMDLAAIQALDNAYWFTADCTCNDKPDSAYLYRGIRTGQHPPPPGYTADDFAVPTLRQLITRFPDMPLNIEVEGDGDAAIATARALLAELTELHRLDATVVSAFDDATIAAVRQLAPDVVASPGLGASAAWVLDGTPLPDDERILQLPPRYDGVDVLTPDVVARSHAAGYLIWVWPDDRSLENPAGYAHLLQLGVDGLNINFPAAGVAAVRAFTEGK